MQTVSTEFAQAFAASDIKADARVTIEFGNNRFNDGQVVTTSGTKVVNRGIDNSLQEEAIQFWAASEAFNNKNRNTMKWLVCDAGATINEFEDGTGYRAINLDDGDSERGWWSQNKSDGTGSFGVAEFVQSEFFEENGTTPFVRRINKISLYTTEGYPNMKEVTVSYKDATVGWIDVATNFVLDEFTYLHEWSVPAEALITGLRVRVHKTWAANDFARISELQGYYIKDVSGDIVNVDVRESRQEYETTVPVGTNSANTLDVELDNTTGQYNIENIDSTYYPYIAANNKVNLELGVRTVEETLVAQSVLDLPGSVGSYASTPWTGSNPKGLFLPGTSGRYASTPNHASLQITGDIHIEADLDLVDWTPTSGMVVVGKQGVPGVTVTGWSLRVGTTGLLTLSWGDGAAKSVTSTTAIPASNGARMKVKATLDVDDGAGNRVAKFYTAAPGAEFTQLGTTVTTAGTTSISTNTTVVEIGGASSGTSFVLNGLVRSVLVKDGIDGTTVLNVNFADESQGWEAGDSAGATGVDATGKTITIFGATSVIRSTLDITDDIDVRVYGIAADDWTPTAVASIVGKWRDNGGFNQRAWLLRLQSNGVLRLYFSTTGTDFPSADSPTSIDSGLPGFGDGSMVNIGIQRTTAGSVQWFRSVDDDPLAPWGSPVSIGAGNLFASTAIVEVGTNNLGGTAPFAGTIGRVEIREGINGAVVASANFRNQAVGTTSFSDSQNNLWSVNGSASIVDDSYTLPETFEYIPYGEFWIDEWSNDGGNVTTSFNARDFSKFIQDEVSNIARTWQNTNIAACFYDLLARSGFAADRVNIDQTNLRGFEILFLKDQSIWNFMQEVAFADQGMFGFDRNGEFYYHSYNKLNTAPHTTVQHEYSWTTNIETGDIQTELYINKVIVRVSPYSVDATGRRPIWSVNENTILGWSKLASNIDADDVTIPVIAAPNQATGNLTVNNWEDTNGYLWLPTFDGEGNVTAGEVVKYASRSDSSFLGCQRGFLGTPATSHTSGAYIGEVNVFDIEFDNAPALRVHYPFVTAIDTLEKLEGEGDPQAHLIVWDYNSFGAKLAIGNIVNWYTLLSGQESTFKDKFDGNADPDDDVLFEFATVVSGIVAVEKTGKQQIGKDAEYTAENRDYIRRYGKNELQIDNAWIQSKAHAEDIASIIIDEYRNPREILRLDVLTYPPVELADRVKVTNYPQLDIINKEYHVIEIAINYDGGLRGSFTLREVKN